MATATLAPDTSTAELYRMPLDLYLRIAELGLLAPSDRVELLDGLLVKKMTKGFPHSNAVSTSLLFLATLLPKGWTIRSEQPIELPGGPWGDSCPEPDVVIAQGNKTTYRQRHPGPTDIGVLIEMADSSLHVDRNALVRYAWAGVTLVWIVNLKKQEVEVYTEPSGPSENPEFARRETFKAGSTLSLVLGGQDVGPIPVEELMG